MVAPVLLHHFFACAKSRLSHGAAQMIFFRVLDIDQWDDGNLRYDLIGCLNLLDRCDKPISILHSMKRVLTPVTGRVIVAVVLPFKPYVEAGKIHLVHICHKLRPGGYKKILFSTQLSINLSCS